MKSFDVEVDVEGFTALDFDKRKLKKSMRGVGREVKKEARRLVARGAISQAGTYPGKDTGALFYSIRDQVSKSGFMVRVESEATNRVMRKGEFYPAILLHGVRRGSVRRKDHRKQKPEGAWRIAPRENYIVEAAKRRRAFAQNAIFQALKDAVKFKK